MRPRENTASAGSCLCLCHCSSYTVHSYQTGILRWVRWRGISANVCRLFLAADQTLTESTSVPPVAVAKPNVQDISATSTSHAQSFIWVSGYGFFYHTLLLKEPGFMTKIKRILESVCTVCGKLKVDPVGHPFRKLSQPTIDLALSL